MSVDKVDFVPFSVPSIGKEEEDAVLNVIRSGWLTTGKITLEFERLFAEKLGAKFALAVNSATSGLILAMEALGIGKNSKILTTPYTFISTATAASHLGAQIEYADIEENSYSIDPAKIEEKLAKDSSIKAVVPVHIAGNPCNMKEICRVAKKYGVAVLEDCAHAFPSKTDDGFCGTLGDIGVFSFYATKTMTTAEGGMIVTNDEKLASRIKKMRLHGIDRDVWNRYTDKKASWLYDVVEPGFKCNLPDLLSAMGIEQLKKSDSFLEKRLAIIDQYNKAFSKYDAFILPPDGKGNAWHLYLLGLNFEKLSCTRDEFASELQKNGLGISMHFIPHYHFSLWEHNENLLGNLTKENGGFCAKNFPNCEKHFLRTVTLPLWPDMSEDMVEKVIDVVIQTGKKYAK
ncbi:MAG: DegT/DnrJ/EryC1/StrS aminotransferase family protein [Treponemataceae bacterium]|nr:DegT/DnrJ/EryC1/StrS aminotransferase family protein [Treponemataceae bacterium]